MHRSRRRGLLEHLVSWFGLRIRRCHACNARFTRFAGSTVLIQDARTAALKLAWFVLMLAGVLLVLAFMVWLFGKQAGFPPGELGRAPAHLLV